MSANTEYNKYFLTEDGWICGESKEWRTSESKPIEGVYFATLTYSSDGDCGYICRPELDLKFVDNCKEKALELIGCIELPKEINESDFKKELERILNKK